MKKTITSIILTLIVLLIVFNTPENYQASTSVAKLPTIEITNKNLITPKGGTSISASKPLIVDYLANHGMKGDISSNIVVSEITVRTAWENNRIQLYRVKVGYASLYGVAVIKDKTVLCVLGGMPTDSIFLADLDKDNLYELYTNVYFGSGIVSLDISGYNIKTKTNYYLSKRMLRDLRLFIKDKALYVEELPTALNSNSEIPIGPLVIHTKNKKATLMVLENKNNPSNYKAFNSIPRVLTIDLVDTEKTQIITEKKTIQKIVDIINAIDYKAMSMKDKGPIQLSSVGGLKIIPDNNIKQSLYVHGAGAIYIPEQLQKELKLSSNICYISRGEVGELYEIVTNYIQSNLIKETLKAVERKYPSSPLTSSKPIMCEITNPYYGDRIYALIKHNLKNGTPKFALYILDNKFKLEAEYVAKFPTSLPYSAYTIFYKGYTITFGGLSGVKKDTKTKKTVPLNISSITIKYNTTSEFSITPTTKLGYIFIIKEKALPTSLSFYNNTNKLQVSSQEAGNKLGYVYNEKTKQFVTISSK